MTAERSNPSLVLVFLRVFLPTLLLMSLLIGYVFYRDMESAAGILELSEERIVETQAEAIQSAMAGVASDLRFLASQNELRRSLQGDQPGYRETLAEGLAAFLFAKRIYRQAALLGANGKERIRVDLRGPRPVEVPPGELRDRSGRPYVQDTQRLPVGDIYVSPLDPGGMAPGEARLPGPVIHFATPLGGEGAQRRILVLDYDSSELLERVRRADREHGGRKGTLHLLDSAGGWLVGPETVQEFSVAIEGQKRGFFGQLYPKAWARISSGREGQFRAPAGLLTFTTINLERLVNQGRTLPQENLWKVVYLVSRQALESYAWEQLARTLALIGISALFLAILSGFLTRVRGRQLAAEARLKEAALTDPMTGLGNRRAFVQHFEYEQNRSRRYHEPLCFILGDLDHFKDINDNHGHEAGDLVLTGVAALLRSSLRSMDSISRWGGEEFIVMLPETSQEGCLFTAEKLRRLVEAKQFHHDATRLQVTMSFGIAAYRPGESLDQTVAAADRGLYLAKQRGRNRVCRWEPRRPDSGSSRQAD